MAHPHNWTPYDQMGLKTTLYKSSLLFRDNLELRHEKPMQLPELDIQLSAFRLDMCVPSESLVQVKAKIFDFGGDWNRCSVER